MAAKGQEPLLPPNPAEYLTDWLFDMGPTTPTGTGAVPITYRDMVAWQEISGITLEPWEGPILRRLSVDYVNQQYEARKRDCPPPYAGTMETVVSNRDRVGMQVSSMFAGIKAAQAAKKKQ